MAKSKRVLFSTLLAASLFGAPSLRAAELAGVTLPDSVEIEGQTRVLNGLGLRLATLFKVKVYVAGLYVPTASKDAQALLSDPGSKLVRMAMLRDLDASQLRDAISEGFAKACVKEECERFAEQSKSVVAAMPAMKKGETLDIELRPDAVVLRKGAQSVARVDAQGLGAVLLRIWIGDNPPNPELKKGLLGLGS